MANIYKSAAELIGNTPLLEVTNIERDLGLKARVLVKLEYFNPAGSVKDRIAKAMIEDAEAKGLLGEGSTIIEPTSGNTGIGLAAIAAAKGYRIILTMPETMSVERRNILKAYGAELVLTEGRSGAHKIQGIGAGFVPEVLNTKVYSEVFRAANEDAFAAAKLLARKEGVSVGISSGAALHGAIELAKRPENAGKTIVALLPDSGDRYYSTALFTE